MIGIEVTVSSCIAVKLKADGSVAASERRPLVEHASPIDEVAAMIGDLEGKFGDFDRIGVAVPGLIARETSAVAYSTHFPELAGKDISAEIASRTGKSATIENDANAAAFAEYRLGAGRDSRHMFFATIGEGVGGAFVIDGRIWHGSAGFAGEFGYMAINSDGMRLEDVASSGNIVRRTRNRFHQDNTSSLSRLDEQAITIDDILDAAAANDDFATLMLQRTGAYVGTAVANVINLLNIETIVIGGQIMSAGNIVLDSVIRSARELSYRPSFDSTLIVAATLGPEAAATGAALLAGGSA